MSLIDFANNEDALAVATIASAVAAIASVVVAAIAYRLSKTGLHSDVHPILRLKYKFGEDKLNFNNEGKGPAINIRLQRTQVHYVDKKVTVEYFIHNNQSRTLYHNEEKGFVISSSNLDSELDIGFSTKDLDLFRYIEDIGHKKVVGILFDDIYGKTYLAQYKFVTVVEDSDKYKTNLIRIRSHGIIRKFFDLVDFYRFKILKKPREWQHMIKNLVDKK